MTREDAGGAERPRVDRLRVTSSMAPIMDPMVADLAAYLETQTGIDIDLFAELDWRARTERVDRGEIEMAWICGLPYVRKADNGEPYGLLAAPVMTGKRYEGRPVYYSEVVVPAASDLHSIGDLRGARWAYNEPQSHSGYNAARVWLARHGLGWDHFKAVYQAGTHSRALSWILSGKVDGAAIDTTVLDWELRKEPGIADKLRAIEVLGPSPIPPWIVHNRVPLEVRRRLRGSLIGISADSGGRELLADHGLLGFADVRDRDYDPIRRWDRQARTVGSPKRARLPRPGKDGSGK